MKCCLFLCLLFLFLYIAAPAQVGQSAQNAHPKADKRVRSALDDLSLAYEMTPTNDFKLKPLATEGERTQLIYVNSITQRYGSLEIREIIAPAFVTEGPLSEQLAVRLLRENGEVKLGAWRAAPISDGDKAGRYLVMYAIQIAADSDVEALRLAIKNAALTADRMEKELTAKDDY
jgi:hypothetical protein